MFRLRFVFTVLLIISLSTASAASLTQTSWPTETLQSPVSYNPHWYQTALGKRYLQTVYRKDYHLIDASKITYFYPSFPFQAMHMPFPGAAYYPQGVPLNKLWFPSFWPTQRQAPWVSERTRAVRNVYSPVDGQWNHTYKPFAGRVEIAHLTGDDIGWWAYYTPGSGIYIDLGKTVAVLNKLDYLHSVMKLSYEDIAKLPAWNVIDLSDPQGDPNKVVFKPWTYLRGLLKGQTITDVADPQQKLTVTATTPLSELLRFAVIGNNKTLNELGLGTDDIDMIVYHDAQKRGLHSVQFLSQPNYVGGWMLEIMFVVTNDHIKDLERDIQLHNHKPCELRYIPTYPSFGDQDQGVLTCDNLPVSQGIRPGLLLN